jgi:hypothetical protein
MSLPGDDHLSLATAELGTPDALFQISRGRYLAKLWTGIGLILVGLAAIGLIWIIGAAGFAVLAKFLLAPPVFGALVLWHMYRNRELFVLVYPTGLLRLCRGEVESYPWAEIRHIQLKVQRVESPEFQFDLAGNIKACWLPVEVPSVQIWNAGLTVVRADGAEAHFGAALADYERLAEEIQKRTFSAGWAEALAQFRDGEPVVFGDIEVLPTGIRFAKKSLAWERVKEVSIAQGMLSIKRSGRWLPWIVRTIHDVPNPHVLFALIAEARKPFAAAQIADSANGEEDADGQPGFSD